MKGVSAFPMSRVINDPPPAVYRIDRQKAMAGVTPDSANKRENSGGTVVSRATGTPYEAVALRPPLALPLLQGRRPARLKERLKIRLKRIELWKLVEL